ncbi:MAG: tetratricopeptide repeat protein [Candidatus Zixiibacteriota bacterium]|jgi:tetratricopeptide (TPR) repeat protein
MAAEEERKRPVEDPHLTRAQDYVREGRISAACAEYLRYADKCEAGGDLMTAIKYYYKVDEYKLLDIKARKRLAELLARVGNKTRAVSTLFEVVDEFLAQGLVEDAIDVLRQNIDIIPERLTLRFRLAELYEQEGQSQKAVNIYLQVLEDHPEEVEAWEALGRLYARRNSVEEALDAYLRASRINEQMGNLIAAARDYEAIASIQHDSTPALKKLIEIYGELGFKNEMVARMLDLARLAEEQGEKERALSIYSKIIEIEPGNEEAQTRLGKSIQVVSILPTGDSLVKDEIPSPDDMPSEPEEETRPGETAFPPGRAIKTVDDLLGFRPDSGESEVGESPEVCYDLGLAYLEMGITEEAIHYLQLASHEPTLRVRACNMLGLCFLEKEMPDMAVKEFERGLRTPNLAEGEAVGLYYNLGVACERVGDHVRALDEYRKAFAIDVNYLDIREKIRKLRNREGS